MALLSIDYTQRYYDGPLPSIFRVQVSNGAGTHADCPLVALRAQATHEGPGRPLRLKRRIEEDGWEKVPMDSHATCM